MRADLAAFGSAGVKAHGRLPWYAPEELDASARELYDRAPEPKTFVTIDSDHTNAGERSRAAVLAWLGERHPR